MVLLWTPALFVKQSLPLNNGRTFGRIDRLLGTVHLALLAYLVWVKMYTLTGLYMLQPCHIHLLVETILLFTKPTTQSARFVQAHSIFMLGAVMAMVLPDTDELIQPFEFEFYWVEHIVISVITPLRLYYLHNDGTFGLKPLLAGAALFNLYHWPLLLLMDLSSRVNLQFMLCPTLGMAGLLEIMPPEVMDMFLSYRSLVAVAFPPLSFTVALGYLILAWLLFRAKVKSS